MIRFDNVTKSYPGTTRPALGDVSLEIGVGEFVFLIGASGSGKSSFLRLVLKEEKPNSGTIHVLGKRLAAMPSRKVPYFRRSLGVVFQDFRLLPSKSVYDNVAFTLQVIGKSRGFIQEAVPDALKMVGLAGKANRMPHELSGGEQQRVAIARALAMDPEALLLDEPTSALDPERKAEVVRVLRELAGGGATMVIVTHEPALAKEICEYAVSLREGRVVAAGVPADVIR